MFFVNIPTGLIRTNALNATNIKHLHKNIILTYIKAGPACTDPNEVLVNSECRCAPDFHKPTPTSKCTALKCKSDNDCITLWETDRVCDKLLGSCLCALGYREYLENGRKCVLHITQSCSTTTKCQDTQEVCVGGHCLPAPNVRYDDKTKKYVPYKCATEMNQCAPHWDDKRRCDTTLNACVCLSDDYRENMLNGRKCEPYAAHVCKDGKTCNKDEVCIEGQCRCPPDTHWDDKTGKCAAHKCTGSIDCSHPWDQYRKCVLPAGKCQCLSHDFRENIKNGRKCEPFVAPICKDAKTCGKTEACVDGHCRCAVDTQWDDLTATCKAHPCTMDGECSPEWDRNRRCDKPTKKCACLTHDFRENKLNGLKCEPFVPKPCVANATNGEAIAANGTCAKGELCVGGKCWCPANQRWDDKTGKCVAFKCTLDAECVTAWDPHRRCDMTNPANHTCACLTKQYWEVKSMGFQCVFGSAYGLIHNSSWLWVLMAGVSSAYLVIGSSTCTVQEQAAMGSNWNNVQMMLGGRAVDLFVEILINQVVTNQDGNRAINYLAINYLGTDLVTQLAKYKISGMKFHICL
ncbi:unnamed protein product [Medioppia subpectinata]|uniref:Uncharacterized protein n=1 Tax=Medioppia subpectinata TaxID=1979941 RepID=A0A7R9PYS4_9ACAR|nr:unnamed protein product [Medioppia subpectinata]CAG2106225.1 unnamed protein product [Medioppia subpectinata]